MWRYFTFILSEAKDLANVRTDFVRSLAHAPDDHDEN